MDRGSHWGGHGIKGNVETFLRKNGENDSRVEEGKRKDSDGEGEKSRGGDRNMWFRNSA